MAVKERSSLDAALHELATVAPGAPLLALGQTVFWDEPMKAGLAVAARRLGSPIRLVAGVHDTDYFAKLPSGKHEAGQFKALPHNDTTTKGLWSAAGEFSTLFGSETVITREMLHAAGLRIGKLGAARPTFMDEATEAWGWRGIVSLDEHAPITKDVQLKQLFQVCQSTMDWAIDSTLQSLSGMGRQKAEELANDLRAKVCDAAEPRTQTVSEFYQRLLPIFYEFCANAPVDIETTATSELLRFNAATCCSSRFELVNLFVDQATRAVACSAYDEAIRGSSGLYELARFGTGAIPFDLILPEHGRGTIRLGTRGAVIMTATPQFLTFKKPLNSISELAEAVERKFGPDCVLVGKAVTLIGMLAPEFVFVFHEGASSYVKYSRALHRKLADKGFSIKMNPILRVKYDAWDALKVCCSWMKLPDPFQRAFGTEEMCAPSFSGRWKEVAHEQESLLATLAGLRRPIELIRFLDRTQGGSWNCLAREYEGLHASLGSLQRSLEEIRSQRYALYDEIRKLRAERLRAEREKGDHFREKIFDKPHTPADVAERSRLTHEVEKIIHSGVEAQNRMLDLRHKQNALLQDEEVQRIHERRRSIEFEAELKRLRLIRQAIICSRGLIQANLRPSAWWFRLVCPDGLWFRETVDNAECYTEPLN
ncbi:MAG: hypothetical protein P4L46_08540 [Fimbriimonas sp.]|nr:hypothetical protein [Fimbriimonas sp.]